MTWIPAFAGMTDLETAGCVRYGIPAKAGIQCRHMTMHRKC